MARLRQYWFHGRTMCDALEEMRTCVKTMNFAPMPSLIEEVQMMANRMEAALVAKKDIPEMLDQREALRSEISKLIKKLPAEKDE